MTDRPPTVAETFRRLVGFLEREKVPFVVVGGIAVGLQGEPRLTRDVDVMITLASAKVWRFAERAKAEGFDIEPELAETQWLASGFVRFWLGPPNHQVASDLMACNSDFLREVSWRAQQARIFGLEVPVASAEDMILLKLSAWRERDVPDIRSIVARQREKLDVGYLKEWASWFAAKNPQFKAVPERLEAVLSNRPLPPCNSG